MAWSKDWERVEQLSAKSLMEECDMLGLPGSECLECYGDFLAWRLKQVGSSDLSMSGNLLTRLSG